MPSSLLRKATSASKRNVGPLTIREWPFALPSWTLESALRPTNTRRFSRPFRRPILPQLASCGSIGLRKGLENLLVFVGRNADSSVQDGKANGHSRIVRGPTFRFDADVAFLSKLDGIAGEIDQNLTDTVGVTQDKIGNISFNSPG